MLGRGIDDDVGAQLQGPLQQRGGEDIVDDELGARGMGELGHRRHIDDAKPGIRRRLDEDRLGLAREGIAPLREIAAVDEDGLDPEARQDLGQHILAGAEEGVGGDDAVAGAQLAGERGEDRGHAGRRGARGLGALEQGHALLEHLHGGIAEARIDEALLPIGEGVLGLLRRAIDIARGHVDGLAGLAEGRAQDAALDELGGEAPILLAAAVGRCGGGRRGARRGGARRRK
jgi:hypothetical protein